MLASHLPHLSRKALLWLFVTVFFFAVVITSVLIVNASIWFLGLLVIFTLVVIGLGPWLL